jgi:PAS domain-containing protein
MCPECQRFVETNVPGRTFSEFLETLTGPVLVVDGAGRVVAANAAAGVVAGVPAASLVGLLGGDALECARARLPGGCGNTFHCATCGLRRVFTECHRSGRPSGPDLVHLDRGQPPLRTWFLVQAQPAGDRVVLRVRPAPPPAAGTDPSDVASAQR